MINLIKILLIFLRSFKSLWVWPRSYQTILRYGSYTYKYFKISQQKTHGNVRRKKNEMGQGCPKEWNGPRMPKE